MASTKATADVPSWADKLPADMTPEELLEAKEAVAPLYQAALVQSGLWGNVVTHLDSEVASRYTLSIPGAVNLAALPAYPTDQVNQQFGGDPAPDPTPDPTPSS